MAEQARPAIVLELGERRPLGEDANRVERERTAQSHAFLSARVRAQVDGDLAERIAEFSNDEHLRPRWKSAEEESTRVGLARVAERNLSVQRLFSLYPLFSARHPVLGSVAALLLFALTVCVGMTVSHLLTVAQ